MQGAGLQPSGIDVNACARAKQILGPDLLAYLLGVDGSSDLAAACEQPTNGQRQVFLEIEQMLVEVSPEPHPLASQIDLMQRLGAFPSGQTVSVANLLRQSAGGALDVPPETSDPVLLGLYALLRTLYPLLLLRSDASRDSVPLLAGTALHDPGRAAFEGAVQQDPSLGQIFTSETETSGWTGSALRSSGAGGTIQLWTFGADRIGIAWQAAKLEVAVPTFDDVAQQLKAQLAAMRRAIQGKTVTVPVRVGLTGVLLPSEVEEIDLGWARVRRASTFDRAVAAQTGIEGSLQTTNAEGETIAIEYAGDLVVELEVPYLVRLQALGLEAGWPEDLANVGQSLDDAIDSIRLGLVLALDAAEPVNVTTSWQLIIDPLSNRLNPRWNDTTRVPNLIPRQLSSSDAENWKIWAQRVAKHRTGSTAVAIRRMLQAIGGRYASDDILVDAVIVWENLFGAAQETTLRIATSMAWLLGTDADDRAARQKQYKKLYGIRSGIVHGVSAKVRPHEISEHAREAVLISVAALRALFSERTDLLALKTSEERSTAIMLDQRILNSSP